MMGRIRGMLRRWLETEGRGVPDILTEEEIAGEARRQEASGEWISWPFDTPTRHFSLSCGCPSCIKHKLMADYYDE